MIRDAVIAVCGLALLGFLFFVIVPSLPETSRLNPQDPACSPGSHNCSLGGATDVPGRPFKPDMPKRPINLEPIACPADAKLCPDGSAVGRTGPNCEFAACPGE